MIDEERSAFVLIQQAAILIGLARALLLGRPGGELPQSGAVRDLPKSQLAHLVSEAIQIWQSAANQAEGAEREKRCQEELPARARRVLLGPNLG
jgi:hypothetical protein